MRPYGYTLTEIILVLAIVSLLSKTAIGGWQHWQQQRRLTETARVMQHFLLRLRAQANWRNQERLLWLHQGTPWCLGSGKPPVDGGCQRGNRLHLLAPYNDIRLIKIVGEPGFYGKRNAARAGSIIFGNQKKTWQLIISSRGRIRLCQQAQADCQ